MTSEQRSTERFYALDSFRGIAALLVALGHVQLAGLYLSFSTLAVDFFFILSGFVLAHRYFFANWAATRMQDFLWQRVIRLWPLHIAMTIVIVSYDLFSGTPLRADLAWRALHSIFLTNLAGFSVPALNPPAWSISAEFIVNVIFVGLLIHRRFLILIVCLLSYAALSSLSDVLKGIYQLEFGFISQGLLRCFGGFLLGILCYDIYQFFQKKDAHPSHLPIWMVNLAEMFLIFALITLGLFYSALPYAAFLFVILFSVMIIVFAHGRGFISKILKNKFLVYLGTISYSIYLVHYVIYYIIRDNIDYFPGEAVALIVFLIAVISLSHLTYTFIEKPCIGYFHGYKENSQIFKTRIIYSSFVCLVFLFSSFAFTAIENVGDKRQKLNRVLEKARNEERLPIYSDSADIYQLGRSFLFVYPNCGLRTSRRDYRFETHTNLDGRLSSSKVHVNPVLDKVGSVCAGVIAAPKGTDWVTIRRISLRGEARWSTDKILISH